MIVNFRVDGKCAREKGRILLKRPQGHCIMNSLDNSGLEVRTDRTDRTDRTNRTNRIFVRSIQAVSLDLPDLLVSPVLPVLLVSPVSLDLPVLLVLLVSLDL